mmetsp:Transcript_36048/g.90758  ORF Transcript_36048/g.90758 Transcript_36048/m.90758 type:complete len:283 (-) Transcript_36048:1097-1945(-)
MEMRGRARSSPAVAARLSIMEHPYTPGSGEEAAGEEAEERRAATGLTSGSEDGRLNEYGLQQSMIKGLDGPQGAGGFTMPSYIAGVAKPSKALVNKRGFALKQECCVNTPLGKGIRWSDHSRATGFALWRTAVVAVFDKLMLLHILYLLRSVALHGANVLGGDHLSVAAGVAVAAVMESKGGPAQLREDWVTVWELLSKAVEPSVHEHEVHGALVAFPNHPYNRSGHLLNALASVYCSNNSVVARMAFEEIQTLVTTEMKEGHVRAHVNEILYKVRLYLNVY